MLPALRSGIGVNGKHHPPGPMALHAPAQPRRIHATTHRSCIPGPVGAQPLRPTEHFRPRRRPESATEIVEELVHLVRAVPGPDDLHSPSLGRPLQCPITDLVPRPLPTIEVHRMGRLDDVGRTDPPLGAFCVKACYRNECIFDFDWRLCDIERFVPGPDVSLADGPLVVRGALRQDPCYLIKCNHADIPSSIAGRALSFSCFIRSSRLTFSPAARACAIRRSVVD